ncbi:cytochrome C oxidase subunit IV family protein [candidate division KSB1 bacterium]|nr:cytochrome C oxidase subunit IV family protein [candidate division KSB1 bacterium]
MSNHHEQEQHLISYSTYFLIWLGLLALTGVTVAVAGFKFKNLSVVVALVIASIKSILVFNYFMHLKYEEAFFRVMLFVTLTFFVIFITLTFFDYSFRGIIF